MVQQKCLKKVSEIMYETISYSVKVKVEPQFLAEQSDPDDNVYVWAYHIQIENQSEFPIQLRSRKWEITDARGRIQEVFGEGVVGEQPLLEPGEVFEYTSGVPLQTPSGFMQGTYTMNVPELDEEIEVDVPPFSLDSPFEMSTLN